MEKRNRFIFQPMVYTTFSVISEDFSCCLNFSLCLPSHTLSYEPVRSQLTFFIFCLEISLANKFISFIFYLLRFLDWHCCQLFIHYIIPITNYIIHITLSQAFSSSFFIGLSESTNTVLAAFIVFFLLLWPKVNATCFRLLLWQQPGFR